MKFKLHKSSHSMGDLYVTYKLCKNYISDYLLRFDLRIKKSQTSKSLGHWLK